TTSPATAFGTERSSCAGATTRIRASARSSSCGGERPSGAAGGRGGAARDRPGYLVADVEPRSGAAAGPVLQRADPAGERGGGRGGRPGCRLGQDRAPDAAALEHARLARDRLGGGPGV